MADQKPPRPVAQIVIGLGISAACAVAASSLAQGCGGQQLTPLVRCKVDAVTKVVPEDPGQLTVSDLFDIIGRLRECREAAARDAGP